MHTVEQGYRGDLLPPFNGVSGLVGGGSQAGGSRAGSGNGTRSEHSPEEGRHRGGPSSRQRVRVLQPYFIVPGKGVVSLFRSKLTELLSHTTEVQKALFKHVSRTISEDWWSQAI